MLHARTRWRKGAFTDPNFTGEVGVAPLRFGQATFNCGFDETLQYTVPVATGLQIICRSAAGCGASPNGTVMYTWPADCEQQTTAANTGYECFGFTMAGTTTGTDTTQLTFEQREQVLPIPLGSATMTGQIVTPRNLPHGDYDIQWVDSSRVVGIQNINPTETCADPQSDNSFGFNVRVRFDGTPNNGPSIDSNAIALVPRGFAYNHGINANDADDDPIGYSFAPNDPTPPTFGPTSAVPGLTMTTSGILQLSSASTTALLDNHLDGTACSDDATCLALTPNDIGLRCIGGACRTGAAYLVKVRINDNRGATSETDMILDPISSGNKPPTLDPIGDRTLFGGVEACILLSANDDPSNGDFGVLPITPDPFTIIPVPPGALASSAFQGSGGNCTSGPVACGTNKTCKTLKWTPPSTPEVPFNVEFSVTNPGTTGAPWNGQDALTVSEVVHFRVTGNSRAPVLSEIAGQTVGADPAHVQALVGGTFQFNALAQSPQADDHLSYDAPYLQFTQCSAGGPCFTPGTPRPTSDITTDVPNLVHQGTDGFGRQVGVITLKDPPSPGVWTLTVRVTDTDNLLTDQKQVVISVGTFSNHPPQFRILPPTEVFTVDGAPTVFPVEAQDLDAADTVTLNMSNNPSGPAPTFGPIIKVGTPCNALDDCCLTSGCTVPTEIRCQQLQANQPNTCVDTSTNPVCSSTNPCRKGYFTWTPSATQAGQAYVIHFNAADASLTSTAESIIHVASSAGTAPIEILGVVPNHGPPALLNSKVGNSCTPATLNTACGVGGTAPLGMACLNTQSGQQCVDTAHQVTVYGQGFTGTLGVSIGGVSALNIIPVGTTAVKFNTPAGTITGSAVDVSVTNGSLQTATLSHGFEYACPSSLCANINDTNFEGSNACAFVTAFPGCTNPDSDGDGFSDAQETAGYIDVDCDGMNTAADLQLPGANSATKDIYVFYDWMDTGGAAEALPNVWHKPFETCVYQHTGFADDCATVNPGIPITQCSFQTTPLVAGVTVIPGSWERVQQSFGAHTTTSSGGTFSNATAFSIGVGSTTSFLKPNEFYEISLKVVDSTGKIQPVVCTSSTGTSFGGCLGGGVATWLSGAQVYVGSPTPVNLHVLKGTHKTHYWVTTFGPQDPTCTVGGTTPVHSAHATNPVVDFFSQKSVNLPLIDGLAYHYALFGHYSNCDGCDTCQTSGLASCGFQTGIRPASCPTSFGSAPLFQASGVASVYGPDVIISLGDYGFSCTEAWIRQEAGVIMHELGHNLSLNHGGTAGDIANNKPNYMSSMNYLYQYAGVQTVAGSNSSAVTYSDGINQDLVETNLVESAAIPFTPANKCPYWTYVFDTTQNKFIETPGNSDTLDWNSDHTPNIASGQTCDPSQVGVPQCCDGDPGCTLGENEPTGFSCVGTGTNGTCDEQADVNQDGSQTSLHDGADWGGLNLLYQCSTAYVPGAAPNCDPTTSSSTASPLVTHCQITSEESIIYARAQGLGSMPAHQVLGEPQKECLDPTSHGVIPVYVDGKKDFDVTQIVLSSLRFASAPVFNTTACSVSDHNGDGFKDLKCMYRQDQLGIGNTTTKVCVTGDLTDTSPFIACFPIQLKNDPLNPCQ